VARAPPAYPCTQSAVVSRLEPPNKGLPKTRRFPFSGVSKIGSNRYKDVERG